MFYIEAFCKNDEYRDFPLKICGPYGSKKEAEENLKKNGWKRGVHIGFFSKTKQGRVLLAQIHSMDELP